MIKDSVACISCGADATARYAAIVAPFIAARVPGLAGRRISLVWCRACDLAFFDPRLGPEELDALYRGYRGPEYQRERNAYEPAYTRQLNELIGNGEREVSARQANMRAFLSRHLDLASIRSVLDHGGDRGQFILDELSSARRVVFEVSGVAPRAGIVARTRWEDVASERYDLILCNHVLEHVSAPADVVRDLRAVTHDGSWLYFEVPAESPFTFDHLPRAKATLKRALLRSPWIADRVFGLFGRPTLHEHVNLYSIESLTHLLDQNGIEVVEARAVELDLGWTRSRVVSAVARPFRERSGHRRRRSARPQARVGGRSGEIRRGLL